MSDLPLPISLPLTQEELPCDDGTPIETWLRWANLEGELLPTEEEIAIQAQQQAQQERQRAELLAARLREAGIYNPI